MKCIICGSEFFDETLPVKTQIKSKDYQHEVPKEICDCCASHKMVYRKARKLPISNDAKVGCIRLAGAIISGCLSCYRCLYLKALEEIALTKRFDGLALDEFLCYDQIVKRPCYANLTFGKMPELISYIRRKEAESLSGDMAEIAGMIEKQL